MDMVFSLDFVSVPKCFGKTFLVRNSSVYKLIFIKKICEEKVIVIRLLVDLLSHNPTMSIFTKYLPFTCDIEAVQTTSENQ